MMPSNLALFNIKSPYAQTLIQPSRDPCSDSCLLMTLALYSRNVLLQITRTFGRSVQSQSVTDHNSPFAFETERNKRCEMQSRG